MTDFSGEKGEKKEELITPGRSMPETLPESIRKFALLRTTIHVPIPGERKRIVRFVTLPSEALLRGAPENVRVDIPFKKSLTPEQAAEETKVGIVHPGPKDEANIEPTLVVLQQEGEETTSFMDGQRYTNDPEVEMAAEFVREHLDNFPPPSIFEES